MNKSEYWNAHVRKNAAFADETKTIKLTVGTLKKLMMEGFDKGAEHAEQQMPPLGKIEEFFGPSIFRYPTKRQ